MAELKQLYKQKLSLLENVLTLTTATTFNNTENDADVYIELMSRRDELFAEMSDIDRSVKKLEVSDNDPELKQLKRSISTTAQKIAHYDGIMKEKATQIMSTLRRDIKGINEGKNISNVYNNSIVVGSSFDWSK